MDLMTEQYEAKTPKCKMQVRRMNTISRSNLYINRVWHYDKRCVLKDLDVLMREGAKSDLDSLRVVTGGDDILLIG